MTKVMICMPAFGQVNCSHTTASLMGLKDALYGAGVPSLFATLSHPDIAELRNMFLTLWFDKTDASHLLFVDADMEFDGALVLDMLAFDEPLVGCIYPKRTSPAGWVGKVAPGAERRGGYVEAEAIGCGLMMIRRDCIQRMLADDLINIIDVGEKSGAPNTMREAGLTRLLCAFDRIPTVGGHLSEDMSFCQRYEATGGTIWANVTHPVGHVGQHVFKGRFADVMG